MVHLNALRHSFAFNGLVQAHQIYVRIHFSLTMGYFHQQVHKAKLHASNHQLFVLVTIILHLNKEDNFSKLGNTYKLWIAADLLMLFAVQTTIYIEFNTFYKS